MSGFATDPGQFSMSGAYYPKGHTFAMFKDAATAQAAAARVAGVPQIGQVQTVSPGEITQAFAERAKSVGGVPSPGREDQFMLRYVELAQRGCAGVLIDMADAAPDDVATELASAGALLAYAYRALVIEELVTPPPPVEGVAVGKL